MSDTKISIEALAAAIRKYAIPKKTYVDYAVKMEEEQAETARWAVCRGCPPGTEDGRARRARNWEVV